MKYQATKEQIKDNYYRILGISYCNAQYLLNYEQPESYCAGVYGWSCDNYNIDGILISTGYNYINNKNMKHVDYDTLKSYEDQACNICSDHSLDYKVRKDMVRSLLNELLESLKA